MSSSDFYPVCKRRRLSSPTYDGLIDDLSPEDLEAVNELEAKYSQGTSNLSTSHLQLAASPSDSTPKVEAPAYSPVDRKSSLPGYSSASNIANNAVSFTKSPTSLAAGFVSARVIDEDREQLPTSDDDPLEPDYDAWFNATSIPASVGFQTAKAVVTNSDTAQVGFKTASNRCFLTLSTDALEKAAVLMKTWEEQVEDELRMSQAASSKLDAEEMHNPFLSSSTPQRQILWPIENTFATPGPSTPTPAEKGFSRVVDGKSTTKINAAPFGSDLKGNSKGFKPPSVIRSTIATDVASPLITRGATTPSVIKHPHPLISAASTPHIPRPNFFVSNSQLPRLGLTPYKANVAPRSTKKFSTPFKAGMRPGEPGRLELTKEQDKTRFGQPELGTTSRISQTPTALPSPLNGKRPPRSLSSNCSYLDNSHLLSPASEPARRSLASSGLLPQSYTGAELKAMGINFAELSRITPDLAMLYSFSSSSMTSVDSPSQTTLGPSAALAELLRLGCSLATQPWVDNHWGLILWKLAGVVCLDPDGERSSPTRRWCWAEVFNQLRYRYERELNRGVRPPLRLIANQDSPASSPMVLCVSKITWTKGGVDDDGTPLLPFPELEVTDGWYRLRAKIDEPLARAIRRKVIRVGRKITLVGARLSSNRKDPSEILEAYDSVSLKIVGNSSHLAPWHAKLGFQERTSISTLHSLTADGGSATLMSIVVMKVYPTAYLEFVEGEDGKKHRQGPRNEKDETAARDRWTAKREAEESKLRFVLENRISKLEGYADHMEQKAGSMFCPDEDDTAPDHIDDIYEQLEDASTTETSDILRRLNYKEAGWLARLIREKVMKEREQSRNEFESELDSICPPREVRDFRVIVAQDARTIRRPATRSAQITVWNVMSLVLKEGGKPGDFKEGQKFLVTNLIPSQQSAWMAPSSDGGSEIYLSTRRDSRWTLIS